MFYFLNKDNHKSSKKKRISPYRQVIKQLVNDINDTDTNAVLIVNSLNPEYRNVLLEDFISWVQAQGDDISYSIAEKKLKDIYAEVGLDRLIIFYISVLNTCLTEDFILRLSRMNNVKDADFFENYEEFQIRKKARTTLAKICLFSVIFSENLLDKSICKFSINDDYSKTKIIKEIKSETMSLFNGMDDIPLLLTQKETDLVYKLINKLRSDGESFAVFNHLKFLLSQHTLERFNAFYCFEDRLENFITNTEFTQNGATRVELSKFYSIPVEAIYQRRIIPPDEGVVIKVLDHPQIESIYLNECSRFNYRIIYGIVRFKDNYEQLYSLKVDINPILVLFTLYSGDVTSILLDFYKTPDTLKNNMGITSSFKFNILPAETWKYRTKNYTIPSNEDINNNNVKITTYVRKTKGNPSKETLNYANKLKLILEENQTLVKEKGRNYNILNI